MARPGRDKREHSFTIYDDAGIPTPESGYEPSFDEALKGGVGGWQEDEDEAVEDADGCAEGHDSGLGAVNELDIDGEQADDERRRESAFTRTSISSLPESTFQRDTERTYKPYTPPVIRPSFRRPESIRRMQMSSPPPFSSRSPRQSILRHSRSRAGTPQSIRSANTRGSPRPRRQISEETQHEEEEEDVKRQYPLVLLHVTLLPITLPWSPEAMQDLLPARFSDNLQLLRSKLSDTMLQRGLLIPHPREEYELLEERLLEALELRDERVTKCGHFHRPRDSLVSSTSSTAEGSTDSGIGSSIEGLLTTDDDAGNLCTTCQHHIKHTKSGVAAGDRKWSIKVYASNGLMRAPAWNAAWSEMERVDIEIMPWISEYTRKALDARQEEDALFERQGREDEEERIRAVVEEQVRLAHEQMTWRAEQTERSGQIHQEKQHHVQKQVIPDAETLPPSVTDKAGSSKALSTTDLPQVYRPSGIPLSVLLKNYIILLAQDRRNVAIFALAVLLLLFGIRGSASKTALSAPPPLTDACIPMQPQSHLAMMEDMTSNTTVDVNAATAGSGGVYTAGLVEVLGNATEGASEPGTTDTAVERLVALAQSVIPQSEEDEVVRSSEISVGLGDHSTIPE